MHKNIMWYQTGWLKKGTIPVKHSQPPPSPLSVLFNQYIFPEIIAGWTGSPKENLWQWMEHAIQARCLSVAEEECIIFLQNYSDKLPETFSLRMRWKICWKTSSLPVSQASASSWSMSLMIHGSNSSFSGQTWRHRRPTQQHIAFQIHHCQWRQHDTHLTAIFHNNLGKPTPEFLHSGFYCS